MGGGISIEVEEIMVGGCEFDDEEESQTFLMPSIGVGVDSFHTADSQTIKESDRREHFKGFFKEDEGIIRRPRSTTR